VRGMNEIFDLSLVKNISLGKPPWRRGSFRLRYVGPYQEAEQRLAGRAQPDFITRMCNRFWMGRADLPRGNVEFLE
jgi:hypothetical protein